MIQFLIKLLVYCCIIFKLFGSFFIFITLGLYLNQFFEPKGLFQYFIFIIVLILLVLILYGLITALTRRIRNNNQNLDKFLEKIDKLSEL